MARGAPDYANNRIGARALLGYDEPLEVIVTQVAIGALDTLDSPVVPANTVWQITQGMMHNEDSATPLIQAASLTATGFLPVLSEPNIPVQQGVYLPGELWLEAGDQFRALFIFATPGDTLRLTLHGTEINVEV